MAKPGSKFRQEYRQTRHYLKKRFGGQAKVSPEKLLRITMYYYTGLIAWHEIQ